MALLALVLSLGHFTVYADNICEPKHVLLTNPTAKQTDACLHWIWYSLGRKTAIDKSFTQQFIRTLLPSSNKQVIKQNPANLITPDYLKLAEVINLLDSHELIKTYLDFIVFTAGTADETRSFGLGKLYTLQAPTVLNALSTYTNIEQRKIINKLAWGLVNNFYPNINKNNYKRLITGEHWELITNKHPKKLLLQEIEIEVIKIVESYS